MLAAAGAGAEADAARGRYGNGTSYLGAYLSNPGKPKPYQARVWRGGKDVHLWAASPPRRGGGAVRRAVEGAKQAAVAPLTREDARCSRRGTRLSRYQGFKAVVLDHLPCPQGPSLPYLYTPHNSACASLRFTRLQHERLRPHFYHPEISATGRTRLLVAMLVGKFQLWSGGLESKIRDAANGR